MIHVLEEFEREKNVEVMTADDFLTRCYEIGVPELEPIQIACLMRVLGKPELSNAIRLNELDQLMANFGNSPPLENGEGNQELVYEQPQQEAKQKEGRKNKKKKQISELMDSNPSFEQTFIKIMNAISSPSVIEEAISQKAYMQLVKSKNKQSEVSVIRKADFLQIVAKIVKLSLPPSIVTQFEPLVYLNPKFSDIY